MTEETKLSTRASRIADIILRLSEMYDVSLPDAADLYYRSATSEMVDEGTSDISSHSPEYIASMIWHETHKQV